MQYPKTRLGSLPLEGAGIALEERVLGGSHDAAAVADQYWVGRAAQDYGDFRGPGRFNIDLSLRRTFRIRERMSLNFNADATNLLNSAQYSGAYAGGLGNTNLVDNPAKGLKVGMGANDAFGTIGLATFDPRQITMRLLLRS